MKNYLQTARAYNLAGLRVIPVDENKRPTCKWAQYQAGQTMRDIEELFKADCYGIAMLTGNGIEVVDIDTKYDLTGTLFNDFMTLNDKINANAIPFTSLTIQQTRSGGYHLIYRCTEIEGNQKLASRPATQAELEEHNATAQRKIDNPDSMPVVLIETRGTGGYILIDPTPGYETQWGAIETIPLISKQQRAALLLAAQNFNEISRNKGPEQKPVVRQEVKGLTPWDDYNAKTNIVDLLLSYGWLYVYEDASRVYLRRPGNTDAKTSGNFHKAKNLFRSFTTSSPLPSETGLTAFGIYTYMDHSGDFSAAARDLYKQGYGDRLDAKQEKEVRTEERQNEILAFVRSTMFDITKDVQEEEACLTVTTGGKQYKVGGLGMIGAVVGPQKSGKSFLVSHIAASGLSGGDMLLNHQLILPPGKQRIIYFDTEQPYYFFHQTQMRIHKLAGQHRNSPMWEGYHLRRLSKKDRVFAIDELLKGRRDVGLVIVDGLVDLCENFNNEQESGKTMDNLLRWSDETKAMFVTVLHLTKSDGFMRGHLGTELQNKCDWSEEVKRDKDENVYRIENRDARFSPFPAFEWTRNEQGEAVVFNSSPVAKPEPAYYQSKAPF